MLPTTEQEEEWCLRAWLEWRRSQGLADLLPLPSPPPGPDRRYSDDDGRVLGVEITRVLDSAAREQESFAEKFIERDVIPRVEGHVPGEVSAVVLLPWSIAPGKRRRVAEMLAQRIVDVSASMRPGERRRCDLHVPDASLRLGLVRGSGCKRLLTLGAAVGPAGRWDPEYAVDAVACAVRAKASRRQLAGAGLNYRVLLLHDRTLGITSQALERAVGQLDSEGVLTAFDAIFLVDTYVPRQCLKAWPASR